MNETSNSLPVRAVPSDKTDQLDEARYRMITENMRDAVWLMDLSFRVTWVSPSVARLRGYTLAEISDMPLEKHITAKSLERANQLEAQYLTPEILKDRDREITIQADLEFNRRNGSTFWLDTNILLLRNTQGEATGYLCVGRDISERRRLEDALRHSESMFRTLAENSPDIIFILSLPENKVVYLNRDDFLGYSPAELAAPQTNLQAIHPEELPLVQDNWLKATQNQPQMIEYRFRSKQGEWEWLQRRITILSGSADGTPEQLLITISIITERKQAEHRLAESNHELGKAIYRAREFTHLAEMRAQEAETLRQAGATVAATLDRAEAISMILEQLARMVPHDSASVQLRRDNISEVVGVHGFSNAQAMIGYAFSIDKEDPIEVVYRTHQPYILEDIRTFPKAFHNPFSSHIHSWMGVPLIIHNAVIGILTLDSTEFNHFTPHHAQLTAAFADQVAITLENARLYQQAVHSAERRAVLYQAAQEINSSLELANVQAVIYKTNQEINVRAWLENVYATIYKATVQLMSSDGLVIALLDEDQQSYENVYLLVHRERHPNTNHPITEGLMGKIIASGRPLQVDDCEEENNAGLCAGLYEGSEQTRSLLAVPLHLGGKIIGALSVQSFTSCAYTNEDHQLLELLASQAAITIQNMRLFAETQRLAITDGLTGLYNHRHLLILARQEFERASRYQRAFSVIMADIDHFKQVNDTYSHLVGNQVLIDLARCFQKNVRQLDILGRYGGEEFLVLLPETDRAQAMQIAERLHSQVEMMRTEIPNHTLAITISLGVATLDTRTDHHLDHLIRRVDDALYRAKNGGRNQVHD